MGSFQETYYDPKFCVAVGDVSGNAPSMLWFDFNLSLFKVYLLLFWGLVMYEI